jgi:MoxR-like ATPase
MLKHYVNAAFPAVAVTTAEEERFIAQTLEEFPDRAAFVVSAAGQLRDARTGAVADGQCAFGKAFAFIAQKEESFLFVLDFQHVVRNAPAYRALKDVLPTLKAKGSMIVLIAPSWQLPPELEHDVPVLDFPLPTREELFSTLEFVRGEFEKMGIDIPAPDASRVLDAAAGLTQQEAENALTLAVTERGAFDAGRIEQEKMRLVRQSGYLEVFPVVPPEHVGGLQALKDYFMQEVIPAKDDELLRVRGILLVGIPGGGKSLSAKAAAAMMGYPLLRMDISSLKGSYIGESESNMRSALKLAEAIAPCVLFLDEVEKAVGGYASSAHTDSGVTLGMVGALLTWLQEHTKPILTIATCNDYSKLPPELTRSGRFDERFFVDLPTRTEREEIAAVHLRRFGVDVNGLPSYIADITAEWTGAEIEQLIKSAARRTRRQVSKAALESAAADIRPISRVRAEEIAALRKWAKDTLRLANTPEDATPSAGRRVKVGGGQRGD